MSIEYERRETRYCVERRLEVFNTTHPESQTQGSVKMGMADKLNDNDDVEKL